MYRLIATISLLVVLVITVSPALGEEVDTTAIVKLQSICPVMGGGINKSLYVDHDGKRIYVCCQGCIGVVKKDPGKYIEQLETEGITLDKTPPQLCPKCGEIKGSEKCCKHDGRMICEKCGLFKDSPGCCKMPKGVEEPMDLCPKCGEIKGSGTCCKFEGCTKCGKCGMKKGSPGCCKMMKYCCNHSTLYCPKCGELRGSEKCCKEEGRVRCEKCGMFKGSPCCCKINAKGKQIEAPDNFEKAQEKYEETEEKLGENILKEKVQKAADKAKTEIKY